MPTQTSNWIDGRIRALLQQLTPLQSATTYSLFAELSALTEARLNLASTPSVRTGLDLTGVPSPSTAALLILRDAREPLTRREIVRRATLGGWMTEGDSPRRINQAISGFMDGASHPKTEWSPLFYTEDDGFSGKDANENRIGLIEWKNKPGSNEQSDGAAVIQ